MSPSPPSCPRGVHFIGSLPLPFTHETLSLLSTTLPNHIIRLPDGEPSTRQNFVYFQHFLFKPRPQLINKRLNTTGNSGQPLHDVEEVKRFLGGLETGYDTAAVESYATFKQLRKQGVIPQGVKFQVCIPTPMQTLSSAISPTYKALVEPYYTAALLRALRNIQTAIPHHDLCIQIDCAHEFGALEGAWKDVPEGEMQRFAPWWLDGPSPPVGQAGAEKQDQEIFEGVMQRIVAFAAPSNVHPTVELGFHLCYGDIGHRHFIEPKDTGLMVKVANAIFSRLKTEDGAQRKVAYIHIPVPKERDDVEYFSPLRDGGLLEALKAGGTELYLGVVREGDEEGTRRRIAAAEKVIGEASGVVWGVATECGMGRTPKEMVGSVLDILKKVSRPVR